MFIIGVPKETGLKQAYNDELSRQIANIQGVFYLDFHASYDCVGNAIVDVLCGGRNDRQRVEMLREYEMLRKKRIECKSRLVKSRLAKLKKACKKTNKPKKQNVVPILKRGSIGVPSFTSKHCHGANTPTTRSDFIDVDVGKGVKVSIPPKLVGINMKRKKNDHPQSSSKKINKIKKKIKINKTKGTHIVSQVSCKKITCPDCNKMFECECDMLDHIISEHQKVCEQTHSKLSGGGPEPSVVHTVKQSPLTIIEVDVIANSRTKISQSRVIKPKAGEVYVFHLTVLGDDWKSDDYMWKQNGIKNVPKTISCIQKDILVDEKC